MKIILSIILLLTFPFFGFSQKDKKISTDSCSNYYLNKVSYFWKKDSLGDNGFRLYSYDLLLKCHPIKKPIFYIFEKLGQPNWVGNDETGTYYYYYYYDGRKLPEKAHLSPARLYICYKVNLNSIYVENVFKGYFE